MVEIRVADVDILDGDTVAEVEMVVDAFEIVVKFVVGFDEEFEMVVVV